MKIFDNLLLFSGLIPNKSRWELVGIGTLKGISMAFCRAEWIDLTITAIKILSVDFFHNKQI